MDLAKRLTEELAAQQAQASGSLGAQPHARPLSPNSEPRARSLEQQDAGMPGEDLFEICILPLVLYFSISFTYFITIFIYFFTGSGSEHGHFQSLQTVHSNQGNLLWGFMHCWDCFLDTGRSLH